MEKSIGVLIYSILNMLERNYCSLETVTVERNRMEVREQFGRRMCNHVNTRPEGNTEEEHAG